MVRRLTAFASALLLTVITACGGPTVTGVVSVQILGGDRDVPLATKTLLTPLVTAGSGVDTSVTWTSSDEDVATVDSGGVVTTLELGEATITATSTADTTKSGSATITVGQPTIADGAFMATVVDPDGAQPTVAAGLLLFTTAPSPSVAPAAVVDIGHPFFAGPVGPVGADGTVVITLPPGTDLPDEVFSTASEFVLNIGSFPGCSLVASAPTTRVTAALFELVTVPGAILYTASGAMLGLATSAPVDFGSSPSTEFLAGLSFYTWVYSEADVTVATEGAGCDSGSQSFAVDVDLAQGWNQLAWTLEYDEVADAIVGFGLSNSAALDVFLSGIIGP